MTPTVMQFSAANGDFSAGAAVRRRSCVRKATRSYTGGLLILAVIVGCSREEERIERPVDPGPPVLLVGLDGMEWDVILPMVRRGELPTIAALMQRGTFGRLSTLSPALSPAIWTSVATGKLPEQHGIASFGEMVPDAPPGQPNFRLFNALDRRAKGLWDIVSDYSLTVAVIGWWMTFPAEPVNGVMVAQTNTASPEQFRSGQVIVKGELIPGAPGQVYPVERQGEVMEILAATHDRLPHLTNEIFGRFAHDPGRFEARLWEMTQWSFRADTTYARVAEKLLTGAPPPNLCAIYIGGPDVAGHRFWRYMRPELYTDAPSADALEDFSRIVPTYYRYADQIVARLLEHYPPDARIILVSDHGMLPVNTDMTFTPDLPPGKMNSADHKTTSPPGIFIAAGAGIRRQLAEGAGLPEAPENLPMIGSVTDVAPTILALLGIPAGDDMEGRPLKNVLGADHLKAHPLRTVRSHDTRKWRAARAEMRRVESPDVAERIEQLRALGYIK